MRSKFISIVLKHRFVDSVRGRRKRRRNKEREKVDKMRGKCGEIKNREMEEI